MSLKDKVLESIEQRPRKLRKLREWYGNEKKLRMILGELEASKKIMYIDGAYCSTKSIMNKTVECTLVKLAKNFGFAAPVDGTEDFFVPGRSLKGAMPGDVVLINEFAVPRKAGSREGEVIAITKEKNNFVGTCVLSDRGRLVCVPDACKDTPILIKRDCENGAMPGDKVAISIVNRNIRHDDHKAVVEMKFGDSDSANQCTKAIIYGAGIEKSFPEYVKAEASKYANAMVFDDEIKTRLDLRDDNIFTIDGASTKDIDDAISAKKTNTGYELSVHIADVSHYVTPKSALNEEAFNRGTSVYYGNKVIPMLPKQLSNGICSLNEGVDRLAFSCIMQMDNNAKITSYKFVKTVINSKIKGVYNELNAILDNTASNDIKVKYAHVVNELSVMTEIYEKLAILRDARGSMDIESGECKLIINEDGVCVDIKKNERGVTEKMIEEFMLCANSCAANFARVKDVPFVYRVHETSSPERVERLVNCLTAMGINFHFDKEIPTQVELSKLLDETRESGVERPVHINVLRSMSKAKYEDVPKGHFGLVLEDYAHFTSPIRRYPDLAIHRILSDMVSGMNEVDVRRKYEKFAKEASTHSSERELVAMTAERDCEDCYKAEYMKQFVGEKFFGTISSVASHGIYVELDNGVEGLVHSSLLSQGEIELTEGVSVFDPLTGKYYKIGYDIEVKVIGVDISAGNIDFALA